MPIGFGTWPLGGRAYGRVEEPAAIAALEAALKLGVRLFDTADIYGDGRAERLLGLVIGDVRDAEIVGKAGYLGEAGAAQDFSPAHLIGALERSLERLRRGRLDVLLLHSPPAEVLAAGEALATLEDLRRAGLVGRIGISLRTVDDFEAALSWTGCEVLEVILNLLDQRPIDHGLLDGARARGVQVLARLPLCSGFLSGHHTRGTAYPPDDRRGRWPREQVEAWISGAERFRFLERSGRSLAQAALAFCAGFPGVTPIPGMKTPEQVRHNTASAAPGQELTSDELRRVREGWSRLSHLPPKAPS